jgi:HlyD family secretion protein
MKKSIKSKTMKYSYIIMTGAFVIFLLSSCRNKEDVAFAYGNFESEDVLVSAEVTGRILDFGIQEGDNVNSGQLLGIIDTSQLTLKKSEIIAASAAIRSRLVQIDEQINVNDVNIRNVNKDLDRVRAMHSEGAATDKQLDDLEGKIDLLKAQNAALRSQKSSVYDELDAQKARLMQAEDQIRKCFLNAPAKGTILETYAREGELAITGKALYSITDLSRLILRAFIDGDQLSSIRLGQKVVVGFDGPGGKQISREGKVSWISSEAEFTPKIIQTRKERVNLVYAVKVIVPNDGSLKIGMPGEITELKQD